jgi:hypothetical protein
MTAILYGNLRAASVSQITQIAQITRGRGHR